MATLLELGDELRNVLALAEAEGGELSTWLDSWFERVSEDLEAKLDSYATLIREHELRAQARKAEADRLAQRAAADANFAKRLKERLKLFMEQTGQHRVETPRFNISLARNGGALPVRLDVSPDLLPVQFQQRTITAATDAIRKALLAGESVPGACLGDRGSHLKIS